MAGCLLPRPNAAAAHRRPLRRNAPRRAYPHATMMRMDEGLAAVLGAAVGVLGTALITPIAGRVQGRLQQEHWRREQRRDTYAAFTTAVERAYDQAVEAEKLLDAAPPDPAAAAGYLEDMRRHVDETDRLASVLLFEGPDEVAEFAQEMNTAIEQLHDALRSWKSAVEADTATTAFKEAAHRALADGVRSGGRFIEGAKRALR